MKILLFILCTITIFHLPACKNTKNPLINETNSLDHLKVVGKVTLENQNEHSNCLIYISELGRGVSSDSIGFFTLPFYDSDSLYSGIFKIYYYLADYRLDSALLKLNKGTVEFGAYSVDSLGRLPDRNLNQILSIESGTNQEIYRIGDQLTFWAKLINLMDTELRIAIYSPYTEFGPISLYRSHENLSFPISPPDIVPAGKLVILYKNGFYLGQASYLVPQGRFINDSLRVIEPSKYYVYPHFDVYVPADNVPEELQKFIKEEWRYIHLGSPPQMDRFPNKYNLPVIEIIE